MTRTCRRHDRAMSYAHGRWVCPQCERSTFANLQRAYKMGDDR